MQLCTISHSTPWSDYRMVGHLEVGKSGPESSDESDNWRPITAVRNVKVQTITKLDLPEQVYDHGSSPSVLRSRIAGRARNPSNLGPQAKTGRTQDGRCWSDSCLCPTRFALTKRVTPPLTLCASFSCPGTETVLYRFVGGDERVPFGEVLFDQSDNMYGGTIGQSRSLTSSGEDSVSAGQRPRSKSSPRYSW